MIRLLKTIDTSARINPRFAATTMLFMLLPRPEIKTAIVPFIS